MTDPAEVRLADLERAVTEWRDARLVIENGAASLSGEDWTRLINAEKELMAMAVKL